jgi:hypothetical protein
VFQIAFRRGLASMGRSLVPAEANALGAFAVTGVATMPLRRDFPVFLGMVASGSLLLVW